MLGLLTLDGRNRPVDQPVVDVSLTDLGFRVYLQLRRPGNMGRSDMS